MDGRLQPVEATEAVLYGPRRVLVCGYTPADQLALLAMMADSGFSDLPAVFADAAEAKMTLAQVLDLPAGHGQGAASALPRAVVLAGIKEKELHAFMAAWRGLGLPRQLWACLTPTSENWTLAALLAELEHERQTLAARRADAGQ
jgi:hypothetical protein